MSQWQRYHQAKRFPDAWIQTYSGGMFWPLEPDPELIEIEDIAWSLAHQCRYAGHTSRFYSVAEHSLWVCGACSPENQLWALLHDASEAYLSDIARPLKQTMPDYQQIELRLMTAIAERFNLSLPMPEEIKELDYRILADERAALMKEAPWEWDIGEPLGLATSIERFNESPKQVYWLFKGKLEAWLKGN